MVAVINAILFLIVVLANAYPCRAFGLFPFIDINTIEDILGGINNIPNLTDDIEKLAEGDFLEKFKKAEHNEDVKLNITELITKYGYKVETHQVETEDGYILTVYRIPGNGKPVLLMHGLLSSAVDFLTVGPGKALPYLLADQGYDVWLGNARGNRKESQGHRSLDAEKDLEQYWDFSWHEIGYYDLPAIIDLVLRKSGESKLKYVGHSQGTTSFFVLCSERPEYNDKISIMVALSAVAWMSHLQSPLLRLIGPAAGVIGEDILQHTIGFYKFNNSNPLVEILTKSVCGETVLSTLICGNIMYALCGFNYKQLNATNMPVIFGHAPSSCASKQLFHYAQGIGSGVFGQYDHGFLKNMAVYGVEKPPVYKVEDITAPVAIFYKKSGDWLAGYEDVLKLRNTLNNVVDFYEVPFPNFCHVDFIWAKDVKELVYDRILKLFKKY